MLPDIVLASKVFVFDKYLIATVLLPQRRRKSKKLIASQLHSPAGHRVSSKTRFRSCFVAFVTQKIGKLLQELAIAY